MRNGKGNVMAERMVMGYWDCEYCKKKGIPGTKQECPSCGSARKKDVKFYMKDAPPEYLSEEEAKNKGKGADWMCPYCRSYNPAVAKKCQSCGYERGSEGEEEKDYFDRQKEKAEKAQNSGITSEPKNTQANEEQKQNAKKKRIFFFLSVFLLLFGLFFAFVMPHAKKFVVSGTPWEYNIEIEKYKEVDHDDWTLPEGATLIDSKQEIHHYDQVLDHYETKTRTYTEQVPDGTHTEYDYTDNGDGTFTEHAREVQDYRTETRTETYEDPVYVDVPVYKTKYYYRIWEWVPERNVMTKGDNKSPHYGKVTLGENEREGAHTEQYWVKGYVKGKGNEKTYEVDKGIWEKIEPDTSIKVKVKGKKILEIKD